MGEGYKSKAKGIEKHVDIPAGVYDPQQIRDALRDRFSEDTMSDRAVDIFADEISNIRRTREGTVPDSGPTGEAIYDSDTGRWRDPDTGRYL